MEGSFRIDSRCASRRKPTRENGDAEQQERCTNERYRVERTYVEENRSHPSRKRCGTDQSNHDCDQCEPDAVAKDQRDHIGRCDPTARRIPISRVRCKTEFASSPYTPTAASSIATTANAPNRAVLNVRSVRDNPMSSESG